MDQRKSLASFLAGPFSCVPGGVLRKDSRWDQAEGGAEFRDLREGKNSNQNLVTKHFVLTCGDKQGR